MRISLIFLIFIFNFCGYGLSQTEIQFSVLWNNKNFTLNTDYPVNFSKDTIQITSLKFYISNLTFWNDNKLVYRAKKKYHFIDVDVPNSTYFLEKIPKKQSFNSIRFDLGIDSLTNISGAIGQDLDPTNGMYWTWQSGYINFKLEGYCKRCPNANHQFQFHIGGYASPFATCKNIQLAVENKSTIGIQMNLEKFFEKIDLTKNFQIMSPSLEAVLLSNLLSNSFTIEE